MKLLLDQNISPRVADTLADLFPGSTHVFRVGLADRGDIEIWEYARENGYLIVSKDSDFVDIAVLRGAPPKVIVVTLGNCSTAQIESLLRMKFNFIRAFDSDPVETALFLP